MLLFAINPILSGIKSLLNCDAYQVTNVERPVEAVTRFLGTRARANRLHPTCKICGAIRTINLLSFSRPIHVPHSSSSSTYHHGISENDFLEIKFEALFQSA